jgi:hypothetical protein
MSIMFIQTARIRSISNDNLFTNVSSKVVRCNRKREYVSLSIPTSVTSKAYLSSGLSFVLGLAPGAPELAAATFETSRYEIQRHINFRVCWFFMEECPFTLDLSIQQHTNSYCTLYNIIPFPASSYVRFSRVLFRILRHKFRE